MGGQDGSRRKILGMAVGGLMGVKKIMVLDEGLSEMVVNSCLEDLEGRMKLKRMWKLIPKAGKKKNK